MEIRSKRTIRVGGPGDFTEVPPGHSIEVEEEIGEQLVARGIAELAIEPARPAPIVNGVSGDGDSTDSDDERFDAVLAACLELDSEDKSLFRADGRPKVEAISKVLDGPVTSEEIDTAWAAIQAE